MAGSDTSDLDKCAVVHTPKLIHTNAHIHMLKNIKIILNLVYQFNATQELGISIANGFVMVTYPPSCHSGIMLNQPNILCFATNY